MQPLQVPRVLLSPLLLSDVAIEILTASGCSLLERHTYCIVPRHLSKRTKLPKEKCLVGLVDVVTFLKMKTFPKNTKNSQKKPQEKNRGYLTFRQLNVLAVIIIFSSSGMVSLEDFSFVLFSLIYIYFLSKVAFPLISPQTECSPVFGEKNRALNLYVSIGALVGLFLPIAYIFEGIYEGDKEGIKAAAPHVFLLASQVFMEGVTFTDKFSLPVRVFVPVFYNSRRIFTIMEWLRSEISKVDEEYGGNLRRVYMGRGLAAANMVFWCFNLFGFLLPVYLPKAFKIYYCGRKLKD